jgi:hypothetical protein
MTTSDVGVGVGSGVSVGRGVSLGGGVLVGVRVGAAVGGGTVFVGVGAIRVKRVLASSPDRLPRAIVSALQSTAIRWER